ANSPSIVRLFSTGLAGFLCVVVAFRTVGSVIRERQQRTLDSLLTLPVERTELLAAKWLGSILRLRRSALFIFAFVLGSFLFLHPLAVPLLLAAVAVHLAFFTSLALWLSIVSRTVLRAHFTMAMILLPFVIAF